MCARRVRPGGVFSRSGRSVERFVVGSIIVKSPRSGANGRKRFRLLENGRRGNTDDGLSLVMKGTSCTVLDNNPIQLVEKGCCSCELLGQHCLYVLPIRILFDPALCKSLFDEILIFRFLLCQMPCHEWDEIRQLALSDLYRIAVPSRGAGRQQRPVSPQEQTYPRLKLGLTEPQQPLGSTAARISSDTRRVAGDCP